MNMIRDEHCHMPSDGPGLRASVASPGHKSVMIVIIVVKKSLAICRRNCTHMVHMHAAAMAATGPWRFLSVVALTQY